MGHVVFETDRLVPMRWPCGPLAIARQGDLTSGGRECLEHWSRPEALALLDGTPVSALVVPWADGSPGDEAHRRALSPLVAAARKRGLAVIGEVAGEADLGPAVAAAEASTLDAVTTESEQSLPGFPILRLRPRGFDDVSPGGFLGVTGNPWPGMKTSAVGAYDAWTGPTGPPWIDSNAWYVRLAWDLVQPRTTWLWFDSSEDEPAPSAAAYEQAVADAAIYGGRWVVSLDRQLRSDLSSGRPEAGDTWVRLARCLTFFEEHREWVSYRPVGSLGVISDYAGVNEFISFEVVNLLSRRNILYRVVHKDRARDASFDGLEMALYLDEDPPHPDLARKLYAFADRGGTLITPPGWKEGRSTDEAPSYPGFQSSRHGSGRVVVTREGLVDPFFVVEGVFGLMRHARDRLRVFNPGVSQFHYAMREDRGSALLQVVRHSRRNFETHTSVWFRRPWAAARRWELALEAPTPAEREPKPPGVEFHLPAVSVYCALEVSGEAGEG